MRNIMRMLFMFGPMIYRQYNKYMSKKSNSNTQNYTEKPQDEMHPRNQPKKPNVKDEDFV